MAHEEGVIGGENASRVTVNATSRKCQIHGGCVVYVAYAMVAYTCSFMNRSKVVSILTQPQLG